MKLYYATGTCSLASHIILNEIGKPFEVERVNLKTKKTQTGTDYFTISERGSVPLLQLDNGDTIREGQVILKYLADQTPESNLAPPHGTMDRIRLDEWLNFISTDLHKSFYVFFYDGGDKAKDLYQTKLNRHFAQIEAHFETNPFIMGDTFTVADAYLYTMITWAMNLGMDCVKTPNITAFVERMENRPSVQATLNAEGLKAKIAA